MLEISYSMAKQDSNFDAPRQPGRPRRRTFLKALGALFGATAVGVISTGESEAHSSPPSSELRMQAQAEHLLRPDLDLTAGRIEESRMKVIAGIPTIQNHSEYCTADGVNVGVSLNETSDNRPLILSTQISLDKISGNELPVESLSRFYRYELLEQLKLNPSEWRNLPDPTLGEGDKPKERKEFIVAGALLDGSYLSLAHITTPSIRGEDVSRTLIVSILYQGSPYYKQRTAFQSAFKSPELS